MYPTISKKLKIKLVSMQPEKQNVYRHQKKYEMAIRNL